MSGILSELHILWLWSAHLHGSSCPCHQKQCCRVWELWLQDTCILHQIILLIWKQWLTVLHVEMWGRTMSFSLSSFPFFFDRNICFKIVLIFYWLAFPQKCCIGVLNVFGCLYTDNCKEVVITGYTQADARSLT